MLALFLNLSIESVVHVCECVRPSIASGTFHYRGKLGGQMVWADDCGGFIYDPIDGFNYLIGN